MGIEDQDWFARWAPYYDTGFVGRQFISRIHRAALKRIKVEPGDAVLDLGCGTGTVVCILDKSGESAKITRQVCVDFSAEMLKVAKGKIGSRPKVDLARGTANLIPIKDEKIDFCYSILAFHHFDRDSALLEIKRIIKPGGRFVIIDIFPKGPIGWLLRAINPVIGHVEYLKLPQFRSALIKLGFRVDTTVKIWPSVFSVEGRKFG